MAQKIPWHPNDDVNLGQSSNDIIPTVLHVSVAVALKENLVPALDHLATELEKKTEAFEAVVKGRSDAFDGCDADDPRPGFLRLCHPDT